jgi:hypothetical protein
MTPINPADGFRIGQAGKVAMVSMCAYIFLDRLDAERGESVHADADESLAKWMHPKGWLMTLGLLPDLMMTAN